ncbi:hypothetical protein ACRAWD_14835 [Caulobacter segnis]
MAAQGPAAGGAGQLLAAHEQAFQAVLLGQSQAGRQAGVEQHGDEHLDRPRLGDRTQDGVEPRRGPGHGDRQGDQGHDHRGHRRAPRAPRR